MKSASQLVWEAHGSPAVVGCQAQEQFRCWLCGGQSLRGQLVDKWLSDGFTSFDRVINPQGSHVCEACVWISSRISPMLGRPAKDGKKFGGNSRNYSHLGETGWRSPVFGDDGTSCVGYANASKGQKPLIREFLAREHAAPWFAAIADSGQKHVLPFAPLNGPGRSGTVMFDDISIVVPEDQTLLSAIMALLTAGCTKDELLSGQLGPRAWQLCGRQLREFEERFGPERGGSWFTLCVWLAQRDEEQVSARIENEKAERAAKKEKANADRRAKRTTANLDRGGLARGKKRVSRDPRSECADALGVAGKPSASGVANERDAGGVGHATVPEPAGPQPAQLGLFGVR